MIDSSRSSNRLHGHHIAVNNETKQQNEHQNNHVEDKVHNYAYQPIMHPLVDNCNEVSKVWVEKLFHWQRQDSEPLKETPAKFVMRWRTSYYTISKELSISFIKKKRVYEKPYKKYGAYSVKGRSKATAETDKWS